MHWTFQVFTAVMLYITIGFLYATPMELLRRRSFRRCPDRNKTITVEDGWGRSEMYNRCHHEGHLHHPDEDIPLLAIYMWLWPLNMAFHVLRLLWMVCVGVFTAVAVVVKGVGAAPVKAVDSIEKRAEEKKMKVVVKATEDNQEARD